MTSEKWPDTFEGVRLTEALHAMPRHSCVIVDFDETLWLRNSTEEYLNSLRPRFLAVAILAVLDVVRPWTLFRGPADAEFFRDWIRVLVTSLLLPWSLPIWRFNAAKRAKLWENRELTTILNSSPLSVCVATFGFDVVVSPLLKHIAPGATLCASGSFWSGHQVRRLGKKEWLLRELSSETVAEAIVITDSKDDIDILEFCRTPFLVRWPGAQYKRAGSDSYLPFLYTQKGKRPGGNYMIYGVLLEDMAFLWIAIAWLMPSPLTGALGLFLLHLSFWVIYEIGYVENDTIATTYEEKPNVAVHSAVYSTRMKPVLAWITALLIAAPGIVLLTVFNFDSLRITSGALINDTNRISVFLLAYGTWVVYLIAARGMFWVYNRLGANPRAYLYVCLQIFRTIGYTFLFRTNIVGMSLLLALIFARWVPYLTYRFAGQYEPKSYRLFLLIYFLILSLAEIPVFEGIVGLQFCAAIIWLVFLARRQLFPLMKMDWIWNTPRNGSSA